MPKLMRDGLFARIVMEHRDVANVVVFTSQAWGRLFDTKGPLVWELILEWSQETIELEAVYSGLGITYRGGDGVPWMMAHNIAWRSQVPKKVTVTDLFYLRRLDVGSFVARLAKHFGLLTTEILGGLTVIAPELPIIDMGELPDAAAGAPGVAQDAPIVDEGGQADPAPIQAPPPPAAARTMPQRMARL
ncbi:hypothetical protein Tco_1431428 [Tanacetum coccineum]